MGISIPQLLILLVIVLLLFGTRRLRHLGSDLGSAIKGFRNAVNDSDQDSADENLEHLNDLSEDDIKQKVDDKAPDYQKK